MEIYSSKSFYNQSRFLSSSHYLSVNRDVTKREHPEPLRPLLPEIEEFSRHNHFRVLHPVLRHVRITRWTSSNNLISIISRLLALGLELPEETFVDIHGYDAVGEAYGTSQRVSYSRHLVLNPIL